jgi:hypothetical protein
MIDQGIDGGEFPAQDSMLATMAILGMCDSVIRRYWPPSSYAPDEIATAFANTAVRGLGALGAERTAIGEVTP